MNVLITSAGRRVSLVKSFQNEIRKYSSCNKVFAVDCNPYLSAACKIADSSSKVPALKDPKYISSLLCYCQKNNINIVIPTIDTELLLLAENKTIFEIENIHIVISDASFIRKCRDKRLTHDLFLRNRIEVACSIDKEEDFDFPIFAKPYDGSSSVGAIIINDNEEFLKHIKNEKLMFLEFLSPKNYKEFTLDLYFSKDSMLKCIVPRERIEVRDGEVSKSITRKNYLISFISERLNNLEGAKGCITLQLFVSRNINSVVGIEINPRFGGGYPLSYLSGANFPKWILQEYYYNQKIEKFNEWEENLLMLRYDDEILVHDFKD